ncbi:hypothetical protein CC86DRAFT_472852 [Ophiobolus disseminans]|uniref:Uncharacterized protein n=1 Tax=Ophiobolus disseminans TaxID=1469910 RepID=A0A6A6ZCM1_9PLEO|nr:hypothetical protein CC86DRAFT_472852 [Ophiobolus disseminans]
MRSFKSKILSAAAWVAPAVAAALPSREIARSDGRLLHYDLQQNYAQATFSVPCIGCLGETRHTDQDDESLILNFTSHAQDEACGSSNITLNGIELPQDWNGDFAAGSGSYTGTTDLEQNESSLQRNLDLEWNTACLHGNQKTDQAAQVLTVSIKAIDGKALDTPSGFTVSFRQQTSPPSLLRFESIPNVLATVSAKDIASSWRDPPTHLRLILTNTTAAAGDPQSAGPSLEEDIRQLKALQAELQELQKIIANKQQHINSQLQKEVKSLTDEINDCEGLACIVKTIANKAHGALSVAIAHSKSSGDYSSETMGRPDLELYAQVHGQVSQKSGGFIETEASDPVVTETSTDDLPSRPTKPSPYIIALEVTLSLLCCGCLIAVIRHKCSSLRTRTERAAAREERDTARAYRRAARKHAWQNWWRGNWRKDHERIEDYEEKRALIQEQEGVLEDVMQEEIRQLRAAHDVVNDLVRDAEEGRVITHGPCNCHHAPPAPASYSSYSPSLASTYPPTSLGDIPSRPLSRTDSLPSYRSDPPSEPPNYESEVDMSQIVANGFRQYRASTTASETASHWTPDSSVVDVSPRPSAETLRYPHSIYTCEEESDVD